MLPVVDLGNPIVLLSLLISTVACLLLVLMYILYVLTGKHDIELKVSSRRESGNAAAGTGGGREIVDEVAEAFQQIDYAAPPADVFPMHLQDLSEEMRSDIRSLISEQGYLPSTSFRVEQLMRDPETSAREIAELVSTNPLLSAQILRTINSSFFALPREVTSIDRAITLLGYNNVRAMIIQDALRSTLPAGRSSQSVSDDLWLHSMVVSACAHYLNSEVPGGEEYDMSTLGLFHDIGKYFLPLLPALGAVNPEMPAIIREEQQYGVNHAVLGGLVATEWKLSEVTAKCVEYHHHPIYYSPDSVPRQYQFPAFLLCLANLICRILGYSGRSRDIFPIRPEYFERFGVSADLVDLVTPGMMQEIEKARQTVSSYLG